MGMETSRTLCIVFAITNLGLFAYNGSPLNLGIGIAMIGWVIFLDLMPRQK
jgi:hypothetical protein